MTKYMLDVLEEAKARIQQDKDTFEHCGRTDTKGHARAMMLIDEMLKEIKDTATLSAPSPSSMEIVKKIRESNGEWQGKPCYTLSDSQAAALIDGLKAALLREAAERAIDWVATHRLNIDTWEPDLRTAILGTEEKQG